MKRSNEKEETKEDFFNVPNNLCDLHCDLLRKVMRVYYYQYARKKKEEKLLSDKMHRNKNYESSHRLRSILSTSIQF